MFSITIDVIQAYINLNLPTLTDQQSHSSSREASCRLRRSSVIFSAHVTLIIVHMLQYKISSIVMILACADCCHTRRGDKHCHYTYMYLVMYCVCVTEQLYWVNTSHLWVNMSSWYTQTGSSQTWITHWLLLTYMYMYMFMQLTEMYGISTEIKMHGSLSAQTGLGRRYVGPTNTHLKHSN